MKDGEEAAYSEWSSRSSIPVARSEYATSDDKIIPLKNPAVLASVAGRSRYAFWFPLLTGEGEGEGDRTRFLP
jgi:hypothetical protein